MVLIGTQQEYPIEPFVEQTGVAFNAENISKALTKCLSKYDVAIGKVRFYMMDGLRANKVLTK